TAHDWLLAAARLSSDPIDRDRRTLRAIEALYRRGDFGRAFGMRKTAAACADSAFRSHVLGLLNPGPDGEAHFTAAVLAADDGSPLYLNALGGRAAVRWTMERFDDALDDVTVALDAGVTGWAVGSLRYIQVASAIELGRTDEARRSMQRARTQDESHR